MNGAFQYFMNNQDEVIALTLQHIQLVGLATVIAILIGVPIGIYLTTNDAVADVVLQIAAIIMTIPSIALFGLMIPVLSVINQGIGFLPALIALILYSQLPIIRNTYVAVQNVDPNMRDAAKGIGMSSWERIRMVEIPIALPVIMAGVRNAVVLSIGIGAIAAFIGAGGLGVLIDQGISRYNRDMIVVGAVGVSLLAIIADTLLGILQRVLTPKGMNINA
ncbi:ABC transporter permease [Salipaludibacillus aurantiacus]|uniref:Osmoprotectant transport system permease protein n=1 Tax=Salipaludibacillus aurantiacus TaxID=1601833 RepID=A0A1H9SDP0_9BACI|nr:ABC transporter permease [Salipaludibacillus aurantiacus]SER83028.1 osmoprotectant transport system permease protein [Salipaludibacillus aurantiacus]